MEILQNSILKLIVRQGSDSDRRAIILDSGELGYAVDTTRLFVGDGFLSGGNVVGNTFRGSQPTITNVAIRPALYGDYGFASDDKKLYVLNSGDGSSLSHWLLVGGVYTSGDSKIAISTSNVITLNPLSANSIANDCVSSPIYMNAGRISINPLSANHISEDALIAPLFISSGRIGISQLSSNSVSFEALSSPISLSNGKISLLPLSAGMISQNAIVFPLIIDNGKIGLSAQIPFHRVSTKTFTVGNGFNAYVDGNYVGNTPFNPLSGNTTLESNQIYANYLGLSGLTTPISKGITTVTRLSAGHYKFIYNTTITGALYIPIVQIQGIDALSSQPRVISTTLSSCVVRVVNSSNVSTDANLYLLINY